MEKSFVLTGKVQKNVVKIHASKKNGEPCNKNLQCKACCDVGNVSSSYQSPLDEVFSGDGMFGFAKRTSCDNEAKKASDLLQTYLRQSQATETESATKVFKSRLIKIKPVNSSKADQVKYFFLSLLF